MPSRVNNFRWGAVAVSSLFALIALVRIGFSYSNTSQAFDEPYHVAAAIEFLDRGTYTLDPVHPPLARIAIGVPLYLGGARYPNLPASESHNANTVGNAVLTASGRYLRNLTLARVGVLPFLLLGCAVVFCWARREYGDFAAVAAVGLFTTLPTVLAFSSIAYTDIAAGATQAAALWAFVLWLDQANWRANWRSNWQTTGWLGFAIGFALLAKATTYIFLPASFLSMAALQWALARGRVVQAAYRRARLVAVAAAIAIVVLWAGYGFAVGHVREGMQISADSVPTFQHFPGPLARIGRNLVLADPRVPAPALMRGLAIAWLMNKVHPSAYILGQLKPGGYWYYFLLGLAVKLPIPFLVLFLAGLFSLGTLARKRAWSALAPAVCAVAILLVTMPVALNGGMRHVLVLFPLLAIVAGRGCFWLWNLAERWRVMGRAALVGLLLWQGVATARASSDYIAYFNEFAGSDPSKVLLAGCDLDCGQDLFRLRRELEARRVSHVNLAMWTSADLSKMGLPEFDIPQPYQRVTGWFAISERALRLGDVFHSSYPRDAFAWLQGYQPVVRVGKTILLYYIPEEAASDYERLNHDSKMRLR